MGKKIYDWEHGATLDEHSKRKHKILREYFRKYLITRCQIPQQSKFRLAIIDGFSGAGKYRCGSPGSPLIFIEVLRETSVEINLRRTAQGLQTIEFECFFFFNDETPGVIDLLKQNTAPLLTEIKEGHPKLHIKASFNKESFEKIYPTIKKMLIDGGYRSVLFNLDQCGYSKVETSSIKDIMSHWNAAEVFLTFSIEALLTYLSPDRTRNKTLSTEPQLLKEILDSLEENPTGLNKKELLGIAEIKVHNYLKNCARYFSPFSINNPGGWKYWLIHFANNYRARQVYNDVLHENKNSQAHFGRAGLNMLEYDPRSEGQLYLFNEESRRFAKNELFDDIPNLIKKHGDAIFLEEFYREIYNETPAHSADIHEMILENPDVKVVTDVGGERRSPHTIRPTDFLKFRRQKSMFPIFFNKEKK